MARRYLSDSHTTWINFTPSYRSPASTRTYMHHPFDSENFINGNSLLNLPSREAAVLWTVEVSRIHLPKRDISGPDWTNLNPQDDIHAAMACGLTLYFKSRDVHITRVEDWEKLIDRTKRHLRLRARGVLRSPRLPVNACLECHEAVFNSIAC
jgi:hypothetical protein